MFELRPLAAGAGPAVLPPRVGLALDGADGVFCVWGATSGLPAAAEARALVAAAVGD